MTLAICMPPDIFATLTLRQVLKESREQFVYNMAGVAGSGGSSYIDSMILRDRDANTAWASAADSVLEERVYYCQNWRADVISLFTDAGQMINQVRYDPYGVPFGISKADLNADGAVNTSDITRFGSIWAGGTGTHPLADWNFDGSVNTSDYTAFLNSYNADTALGRGNLSYIHTHLGGDNRKAYAGYELDPVLADADAATGKNWHGFYHVRNRVYLSQLGRWTRRDPVAAVDDPNKYWYAPVSPSLVSDPAGLEVVFNKPPCLGIIIWPCGKCGEVRGPCDPYEIWSPPSFNPKLTPPPPRRRSPPDDTDNPNPPIPNEPYDGKPWWSYAACVKAKSGNNSSCQSLCDSSHWNNESCFQACECFVNNNAMTTCFTCCLNAGDSEAGQGCAGITRKIPKPPSPLKELNISGLSIQ